MKITVQPVMEVDLPEVLTIRNASYPTKLSMRELATWIHSTGHFLLCARCRSVAVGYIHVRMNSGLLSICKLAVLPDCRRQGVGRALLEIVKGNFWPCERIEVDVPESDLQSCAFLESCGFELAKIVDDESEDHFLFRCKLDRQPITVKTTGRLRNQKKLAESAVSQ